MTSEQGEHYRQRCIELEYALRRIMRLVGMRSDRVALPQDTCDRIRAECRPFEGLSRDSEGGM